MWKCQLSAPEADLSFSVTALEKDTSFATSTVVVVGPGDFQNTFDVDGLEETVDERFFKVVFGGGVAFLQDDFEDFTKTDGTLLVSNDSKARASGTVGGLFRLGEIPVFWGPERRQMSLLVSFQFTQGTTSTLDGVLFGGGLELNPYLHVVGGGGVRKGKELSPGFRRAAHAAIQTQIAANNPAFARFATYKLENGDESILDGLPLTMPGSDAPFFPGEPIVDSYNWSFFLGITVPVRLNALLGGQ